MGSTGNAAFSGTAPVGSRFGIVVARFNEAITEGLLRGATDALTEHGVGGDRITLVRVPGAYEIPLAARRLAEGHAKTGPVDAVIALGCLIKGDTMHFEYIASAVSHGIMDVSIATNVPIAFGVLTTLTEEQARVRAANDRQNKGREAALAAIEMVSVLASSGNPLSVGK